MKNTAKQTSSHHSPEFFLVNASEVENRLDPFFYRPVFKKLVEAVNNAGDDSIPLADIIEKSLAGEWGSSPDDFDGDPDYELCYVLRNTNFDNKYNLSYADVAERYIKKTKIKKLALQKGEILIEKSGGSPAQPVGRVAFVDSLPSDKPVLYSNFLQKIRISDEGFLPEYVFAFLQTIYHLGYTEYLQNQTTGIKNLRLDDFFKIKIAKLPLKEQKGISNFASSARKKAMDLERKAEDTLASIDTYVLEELNIEISEEGAEQIFQVWSNDVSTRLDPEYYQPLSFSFTGFEELSNYADIQGGYAFKSKEYVAKGIPLIRIKNITSEGIDMNNPAMINEEYETTMKRFLLNENDLLVAMTGATIGKVANVEGKHLPAFLNQRVGRFILKNNINSNYLKAILQTRIFTEQIRQLSLGGAQPNISGESIGRVKVPVPKMAKQKRIGAEVANRKKRAHHLKQESRQVIEEMRERIQDMILT